MQIKEEIRDLVYKILKEDITINLSVEEDYGYYKSPCISIGVELLLDDEVISSSSSRFYFPKQDEDL